MKKLVISLSLLVISCQGVDTDYIYRNIVRNLECRWNKKIQECLCVSQIEGAGEVNPTRSIAFVIHKTEQECRTLGAEQTTEGEK